MKDFCYEGKVNDKPCLLRIDMGSDISIINNNFIESCKPKIDNCNVKYLTGEQVSIRYKTIVKGRFAKYYVESMLIVKINDNFDYFGCRFS